MCILENKGNTIISKILKTRISSCRLRLAYFLEDN
jgi:hypothetical protein